MIQRNIKVGQQVTARLKTRQRRDKACEWLLIWGEVIETGEGQTTVKLSRQFYARASQNGVPAEYTVSNRDVTLR